MPLGHLRPIDGSGTPQGCIAPVAAPRPSAPGWRLGWLGLPDHLVDPVIRLRNRGDAHSSTVTQTIVERLVTGDDQWFDRVLAAANALYRQRAGVLIDALHDQLPGAFQTQAPEGGLFLWPRLADDEVDAAALYQRTAARTLTIPI